MARIRYADLIRSETPIRRQRYFADRAYQLEREAQAEQQRQQEAMLAEQERQFNESLGLQRQQAKDFKQQGDTSNIITGLGLAKAGYPYLKKGYNALMSDEAPRTYGLSTREPYGMPNQPDYNRAYPDMAINDPNAPIVDPNVGVSKQYPDMAFNDTNAPFLTSPPVEWGTPLQRMYPDMAIDESGAASGIYGSGSAAGYGGAGADLAGLGPGIGFEGAGAGADLAGLGPGTGFEGAGAAAAGEGSSGIGSWAAGGGALAAAPGLLMDVAEGGDEGLTGKALNGLLGEHGLGGFLGGLLGIGDSGNPANFNYAVNFNPVSQGDHDIQTGANTIFPDPYGVYRDLYGRAVRNPEALKFMREAAGGKRVPFDANSQEFKNFINELQRLDKGKQGDDFGANLASLPDMF